MRSACPIAAIRDCILLTCVLSIWSCAAEEIQVPILRAPSLGNALRGVTVYLPPIADKRPSTGYCTDGCNVLVADVSGPFTNTLKLALADAGAQVVDDPQAPYSIEIELTSFRGFDNSYWVSVELSTIIKHRGQRMWSGPYANSMNTGYLGARGASTAVSQVVEKIRETLVEQRKAEGASPSLAGTLSNATADLRLKVAQRILVLPLKRLGGVPEASAALIGSFLLSQLSGVQNLTAMGVADLDAILSVDKKKQALGCDDVACLADLGGALGTDLVLHGDIGRLGKVFNINVSVLRSRDGAVVTRASLLGEEREDAVAKRIPGLVEELISRLNR